MNIFSRLGIILLILCAMSSSVFAEVVSYQPSAWAAEKIVISTQAGIMPEGFATLPYTANITRLAYCKLLMSTASAYGYPLPTVNENHPFTDTEDINAEQAYLLGLTKGTASGIFSPELSLTREMAAVMLSKLRMLFQPEYYDNNHGWDNTSLDTLVDVQPMDEWQTQRILKNYANDGTHVSVWARSYLTDVYSRGIFAGVGGGILQPQGNITREQAVLLSLNLLSYCKELRITLAGVDTCVLPAPASIYITDSFFKGDVELFWNAIPAATSYEITISKNGTVVYAARTNDTSLDLRTSSNFYDPATGTTTTTNTLYESIFGSDKQEIKASISVVPVNSAGMPSIFFFKREFKILPWLNVNEMLYGDPAKSSFANTAEALPYLKSISVKAWKRSSSGSKTTYTMTLLVNKNLAETAKKIFAEIYNGSEKFPIKASAGYQWRGGTSQHNAGAAIDINPNENYYLGSDGSIKAGSLWQPGSNPYSIKPSGDVVQAFNNNGWHWSPDMNWSNGADYMHFSLLGR